MALSDAERQKRCREKKRGGPPVGRWAGHISLAKIAAAVGIKKSTLAMLRWIERHAPDVLPGLDGAWKPAPMYRKLKTEYDGVVFRAWWARHTEGHTDRLVVERENGRFVARWISGGTDCPGDCDQPGEAI